MANAFIVHGAFGCPEENWFPWLKKELNAFGLEVFVPRFPTPENQSLKNWLKVFSEYEENLTEESILISHSLGVPFILSVLEKTESPVKASFFVSGFTGLLGKPEFDQINKSFAVKEFDWKKIKKNCPKFFAFHSDNDPFVPLEKAEFISKKLNASLIIVNGAGHFNEKAGYTKFELLLEKIKQEI